MLSGAVGERHQSGSYADDQLCQRNAARGDSTGNRFPGSRNRSGCGVHDGPGRGHNPNEPCARGGNVHDCASVHHIAIVVVDVYIVGALLRHNELYADRHGHEFRERVGCELEWLAARDYICKLDTTDRNDYGSGYGYSGNRSSFRI